MRKPHLTLGVAVALALGLAPGAASAKPQTAAPRQTAPASALPAVPKLTLVAPKPGLRPAKPALALPKLALDEELRRAARTKPREETPSGAARARTRDKREPPPCLKSPVVLTRQLGDEIERRELSLAFCDGKFNPSALDALSVLARSRSVELPQPSAIKAYQKLPLDTGPSDRRRNPAFVTERIMRLHPGLVERLQRVAEHFPGRTFEVVSGHRPDARVTSRHHHGRALDFRVQGVTRERLRDFLRTFEETGVGYYPNSSFVHMDVRDDKGYWVDRSGPGEPADYGVWPPPKREIERAQARILEGALAELSQLDAHAALRSAPPHRTRFALEREAPRDYEKEKIVAAAARLGQAFPSTRARAQSSEPQERGDEMSAREVEKIRAEALKALAELR